MRPQLGAVDRPAAAQSRFLGLAASQYAHKTRLTPNRVAAEDSRHYENVFIPGFDDADGGCSAPAG
jgi:hypothetical protein